MNYKLVKSQGNNRVILIFSGWAMDDTPFRHVSRPGYDTLVVWDYRNFDIDWSVVAPYDEIVLIAWSMGVYAASSTIHAINQKISAKIAVNGTISPVDNLRGIPEHIYTATAATLNERNLQKFMRRMCGDRQTFEHFMQAAPQRQIDELVDELNAIYPEPWFGNVKVTDWDRAVIGRDDAIFPACNQQRAWRGTPVTVVDRPHYIDLQEIVDAYVIDKDNAARHFEAGRETYETNTPVQREIVRRLIDAVMRLRLNNQVSMTAAVGLEIGCGSGALTRHLSRMMTEGHLYLWDTNSSAPAGISHSGFTSCDAEIQICNTQSNRFDLIATSSTIQWFNSPSRFLCECGRVLRPGGLLMVTAFVKGNMHQLSYAAGVGLSLPTEIQWREMIPACFDVLDWAQDDYDMTFEQPVEVLRHLKLSGVNGLGRTAGVIAPAAILRRYPLMLDGLYHLTYRTIRFILKKKENE